MLVITAPGTEAGGSGIPGLAWANSEISISEANQQQRCESFTFGEEGGCAPQQDRAKHDSYGGLLEASYG